MSSLTMSPFQKEKFLFFFNFYEPSDMGFLDPKSHDRFMKRVLKFTGWDPEKAKAKECSEIHSEIFEILFEKARKMKGMDGMVCFDQWLDLWARLLQGCKGIGDFPVWIRLLPKTLFHIMDRNNDKVLGLKELESFYKDMIHLPKSIVEARALDAYNAMTDEGRYPLHLRSFEMIFSNFLIGRTPYGPGRHIFGCFDHASTPFKLIQSASDEENDNNSDSKSDKSDDSGVMREKELSGPSGMMRARPRLTSTNSLSLDGRRM